MKSGKWSSPRKRTRLQDRHRPPGSRSSPATNDLAGQQGRSTDIGNPPEGVAFSANIDQRTDNGTNQGTEYGNPAVPYFEHVQEVVFIVFPFKSYIINTSTNDCGRHAKQEQIHEKFLWNTKTLPREWPVTARQSTQTQNQAIPMNTRDPMENATGSMSNVASFITSLVLVQIVHIFSDRSCQFVRKLRAIQSHLFQSVVHSATSIITARLRPGRTGMVTRGMSVSIIRVVSSSRRSYCLSSPGFQSHNKGNPFIVSNGSCTE